MSRTLPRDATLLPLQSGQLLLSADHAVFCRVEPHQVEALQRAQRGELALDRLEPPLLQQLERHGFFDQPRPVEPDRPSIQLQLTNACNLACSYCCTNSGAAREQEVSYESLCRVVDSAAELMGEDGQMALLGGEPFLVPWAADLAQRIVDHGHELTIFTNGIPFAGDEALARRVAGLCGRGAQIRVSLAGPTAELCDGESGAARFEAALAGIGQLARFGAQPVVDLMVLPEHVEQLATHLPALRRRLPPETRIALGVLYLSGREEGQHLFPSRGALEQALDRIAFEAGERISAPEVGPLAYRREGCGCAMGQHLHVRSDGALFNCFKMEERVGHLQDEPFESAVRRVHATPHPARTLALCSACPLATLCGGGCRSDNLLYTGDADRPVCDEWRVRVLCELLAEDRITALEWPAHHLLAEAHARGIPAPERLVPRLRSRHLREP